MYVSDCLFFSIMLLLLVIMGFIATNEHFTTHDWEKSHHRTLRNRLEDGIKSVDVVKVKNNPCCMARTKVCMACEMGITVASFCEKIAPLHEEDFGCASNLQKIPNKKTWLKVRPCCGRLGNRLFQLASGYGIAATHDANLCFPRWRMDLLPTLLQGPFPPDCPDVFPKHPQYEKGHSMFQHFPKSDNMFLSTYLESWRYFEPIKEDIRKRFRIRDDIKKQAEDYVSAHGGTLKTVGIHVRKNYEDTNLQFPPESYFEDAMRHFEGEVHFIVVSDNITWCTEQSMFKRPNIHVNTETHSPALDLAILASCDSVIMSIGTFGWWGGWFSGGEVVYYKDAFLMNHDVNKGQVVVADFYPEEWVGIGMNLFNIADANICCQAETPICKACHEGISVEEYLKKEKPISQQDKNNLDNWNRAMTRIGTPLPKFEDINGGTIIDVGANVGVFSYNVRKICKDCRIMAFEAVPLFAKYIKTRNIGNIDVYPFGLSDKTGEADFWMSKDGNYGWNTMIPAEGGRKKMKKMKMNFKVFDDLNIDVGNLKLIKIDTEGAEYKVLRGLNKVIQKYKPKLLIEFGFGKHHPAYKQVINEFDKLIDMGYTCNINYKNVNKLENLY